MTRKEALVVLDRTEPVSETWNRVLLARANDRPTAWDYVQRIFSNFVELHGDRSFRDDPSVLAGLASLDGRSVAIVAHFKGKSFKDRVQRNFGMAHPEGYRKALRVMRLAEQFGLPVISLIDTPGAYPGIEAEERGQVEAIARNIQEMFEITVPIVATVIGEGGSGGALALGVGDRVLMMENSIYSVISPEACAAILWNDPSMSAEAASQLRMTARHLHGLGIVDEIIPEPEGGAQKDVAKMSQSLKAALLKALSEIEDLPREDLLSRRYEKFHGMVRYRLLT
ncbi:MAG: acetyl-CoA carboxylase carboxyltransferase subunit alpha [Nitrospirae bacterium]|nr:acetyl-CoA carboxylase carboxyltransferase subunit alpha [Nitrospirota bacterium]